MPDEITTLREEVAALRADLKVLRAEHDKLLHVVGILPLEDDETGEWPEFPHVGSECVAVRQSPFHIPIIMRAFDDSACISFKDENHRSRLELSIDSKGARFEMRNAEGKLIFQLAEADDGSGQMCVCDSVGNPRAGLRVNQFGGVVNVIDTQGKPQAFLLGTPTGGEVMAVSVAHNASATMKATPNGGVLSVHEPGGQLMGFLSASAETGGVSIYGPHGSLAASLIVTEAGGTAVFQDINGDLVAKFPADPTDEEPEEYRDSDD